MTARMRIRDLWLQWWTSAGHLAAVLEREIVKRSTQVEQLVNTAWVSPAILLLFQLKLKEFFRGGWAKSSKEERPCLFWQFQNYLSIDSTEVRRVRLLPMKSETSVVD